MHIYRFTNSRGRFHGGIAVELLDNGAYVVSDAWEPTPKVSVPASFGYVSFDHNPFVQAEVKHELLPIDTPVRWQDKRVAEVASHLGEGFAAWWAEHGPAIRKEMYTTHKKD